MAVKKVVKKRINSKDKGSRFERKICNLFKEHFNVTAYKTPGSGAWTSRAVGNTMQYLSSGDIVIEEFPNIIIECKNYKSLFLTNNMKNIPPKDSIAAFWDKLETEAIKFKKIPFLICKEYSSPIMLFMSNKAYNKLSGYVDSFDYTIKIDTDKISIIGVRFEEFLLLDKEQLNSIIYDIHVSSY